MPDRPSLHVRVRLARLRGNLLCVLNFDVLQKQGPDVLAPIHPLPAREFVHGCSGAARQLRRKQVGWTAFGTDGLLCHGLTVARDDVISADGRYTPIQPGVEKARPRHLDA